MQRMHQSYKYMKTQKETKWVCIQLACSFKTQGDLRKPIIGIYKRSSIMKNSHQYMKVTKQETPYHEDHGATLKHKSGKRIVALSLLSFSLIFLFGPIFYGLFFSSSFYFSSGVSSRLVGESQSPSSFPHWGNALIIMIITLLFYLQLNNYNSILRTKYDSM